MPASQDHISLHTPMEANLVAGGATFRVWAPRAQEVYVRYDGHWASEEPNRLIRDGLGYWTGFIPGIIEGTQYKFHVVGVAPPTYKRDPYARELSFDPPYPHCNCIVRSSGSYQWRDQGFRPPSFNDLIIYQYHIGAYYIPARRLGGEGHFLDVLDKLDYLLALGVNALQPLPVVEFPVGFSLGYNGTDLFSPEMQYATVDLGDLNQHLATINALLNRRGYAPLTIGDITGAMNQLKVLIDVCHVYELAIILDVVYNHAGGDFGDESIYFFDNMSRGNNNDSLYFTDQGWAGGLVFAFWEKEVRQFLIDNAGFFLREYHVDGFRYDEVSVIVSHSNDGWRFCEDLTQTVRFEKPNAIQIAEHWPVNPWIVKPLSEGGAGFDATWNDGLRDSIRAAISQAVQGRDGFVDLDPTAEHLRRPPDFPASWKAVQYLESHDNVYLPHSDRVPRIAALGVGDPTNARSWYACSRARVATGLLITAPGIPMLFMGQEFLEDKPWSDNLAAAPENLIWWDGLLTDKSMVDFLRFTQEIIRLRRHHPALRGEQINVFHIHNQNRVIAFHRWLEGIGRDVVVVASLNESTFYSYNLGFPVSGHWFEVFNSDVYDNWVNPLRAGNGGSIAANDSPLHDLPSSAPIVIPANSILVFARDTED